MAINKGIGEMVLVRITAGGAVTAFDFRQIAASGEIACFRVFDRELPPDLLEAWRGAVSKIAQYARAQGKYAAPEAMRDSVKVFEARELMSKELSKKMDAIIKKGEK